MDPALLEKAILDRKEKTGKYPKAIVPVALYGMPYRIDEIMWYATQARDAYPYYQHTAIGYNYRMSNVCAGSGRGQMTVLDAHIVHHKHVQALYEEVVKTAVGGAAGVIHQVDSAVTDCQPNENRRTSERRAKLA